MSLVKTLLAWRHRLGFTLFYWLVVFIAMAFVSTLAGAEVSLRAVDSQDERIRASAYLYGEQKISQIVQVPRDGLMGLDIWLLSHKLPEEGELIVHLTQPDKVDLEIRQITIPFAEIPDQQPLHISFPEIAVTTAPVVKITLEAPILTRAQAFSVLGGDNNYSHGMLLLNDRPRPQEDLSFRLYSQNRVGDEFLPVSRFADERPGIFGQPGFYASIFWLCFATYIWALIAFVRWLLSQQRQFAKSTDL
jgi:hypothetical protein